jgi:hypothetical protein
MSSIAPTPPALSLPLKSLKSGKAVPGPHRPRRDMYAMLRSADAPVAEQ